MKPPWPTKKLGEICNFQFGFSFKASDFNLEGKGLPVIRIGDLEKQSPGIFYDKTYDSRYLVNPGDILIGLSGTITTGIWNGPKALLNQRVVKLENFKNADKKFIFYSLPKALKKLSEELFRSAVKNVLKHHLYNLEISFPPLNKQQKIVYVLDTIQSAVEVQEKIIEKTKELKKSLMADLFKYGGPSFRKGRKLKKTEIGEIPEDWGVVGLGEVCTPRKEQILPKENEIYVGLEHLDPGATKLNRYGNSREVKSLKNKFYPQDILYGKLRPYLDKAVIAENKGVCSTDLIVIRCNKLKVLPFYLINLIHTSYFLNFATGTISGTNHPRTSWDSLKIFKIPLPSLPELREIAEILQTVDQKIEIEQKKKELNEELFKTMLNKLMNGEIDVNLLRVSELASYELKDYTS
ncbi:MAG: restriction endonuclease subunit S [Microgenomates group bacterium]